MTFEQRVERIFRESGLTALTERDLEFYERGRSAGRASMTTVSMNNEERSIYVAAYVSGGLRVAWQRVEAYRLELREARLAPDLKYNQMLLEFAAPSPKGPVACGACGGLAVKVDRVGTRRCLGCNVAVD